MKVEFVGEALFGFHPTEPSRLINKNQVRMIRGNEYSDLPEGYVINGASIPRLLRPFIDMIHPAYMMSTMFHDGHVGEFDQQKIKVISLEGGSERELSWKEAAQWLSDGMQSEGSGKLLRRAFYHAVMSLKRARRILKNFH